MPAEDLSPGPIESAVRVELAFPRSSVPVAAKPTLEIPILGSVVTVVQAVPRSMFFGRVAFGHLVTQTAVISASDNAPFRVEHVDVFPRDGGISVAKLGRKFGDGNSIALDVNAVPTKSGVQNASVSIKVRESKSGLKYTVPVSVQYDGIPAADK